MRKDSGCGFSKSSSIFHLFGERRPFFGDIIAGFGSCSMLRSSIFHFVIYSGWRRERFGPFGMVSVNHSADQLKHIIRHLRNYSRKGAVYCVGIY